jgi:hypothetical protein
LLDLYLQISRDGYTSQSAESPMVSSDVKPWSSLHSKYWPLSIVRVQLKDTTTWESVTRLTQGNSHQLFLVHLSQYILSSLIVWIRQTGKTICTGLWSNHMKPVETEFHEISWNFIKLKLMKFHENIYELSWNFMNICWRFFFHEKIMNFHEISWTFVDGFFFIINSFMKFYEIFHHFMERFSPGKALSVFSNVMITIHSANNVHFAPLSIYYQIFLIKFSHLASWLDLQKHIFLHFLWLHYTAMCNVILPGCFGIFWSAQANWQLLVARG